jgi:hypothetical protein
MAPPRLPFPLALSLAFSLASTIFLLFVGLTAATARRAWAQEVADDPRLSAPDRLDRTSYEDEPDDDGGLWISVLAQGRAVEDVDMNAPAPGRDESSFSAGVVVGGTFDALVGSKTVVAMPAEAPREERRAREPPTRVDAALARGAFRAALVRDGDTATEERLDSLSTRSRTSASLPELRLRVMRVIDEDQALSPTAYDPSRTTASGGTSTWLEARATWRLDRWVFTREEIAVEKMRMARVRARRAIEHDVLEALGRWQRARWTSLDPEAPADSRLTAELEASAAEATLDVITDGWFGRELARRAR